MKNFIAGILAMGIVLFALAARAADESAAPSGATAEAVEPADGGSAEAEAEEALVSGGAEVDLNARYVWRGVAFSEGPVMNPCVWLTVGDLTIMGWGNMPITDEDYDWGKFNEADIYATYAFEKDAFSGEVTYQHYFYPYYEDEATGEVSVKLAWAFDALSVFTTHTLDVENYAGSYFAELGVEMENELSDSATLSGSAYLGYGNGEFNETYIGPDFGALDVFGASLAVTWYATDNLYLRPHVEYTSLLHEDLRQAASEPDLVNVGIAAGVEF